MTANKKAASPVQAGTLGETASKTTAFNNTTSLLVAQSAAAQRQRILEHLKCGPLTTLQARKQLDIMHPAARCLELRKRGLDIRTEWTTEYSVGGSKHRIAKYSLEAQANEGER